MMLLIRCSICGKPINEFYRCSECGEWFCWDCGQTSLRHSVCDACRVLSHTSENLTDEELAVRVVDELSRDMWPPRGVSLREVFLKRHERALDIMIRVCDLLEEENGKSN